MYARVRFATGILLFVFSATAALGQTFLGPTPYVSQADSPFAAGITAGTTALETFEDGLLNTPGVSASAGAPFGPSGITDSVDADDGTIDGSGTAGNSFFSGNGAAGVRFTFDEGILGALPTHAGIVWTDGAGTTTFEAFDGDGTSLGTLGPVALADGSFGGTTAEDRFFGIEFAGGISAIHISNTSGGIEVDHLQYEIEPAAPVADLSITKTDSPDPVTAGGTITYTITATNNGPDGATNVVVTDALPAGTTFVSATPSQGSCSGTSTVTCNLGSLANGASATISLVVTATSAGSPNNTATVTAAESDPNQTNSTASARTVVNAADLPPIPALDGKALVVLALLLAAVAAMALKS